VSAARLVGLDDIVEARRRIWPLLRETPVEQMDSLSRLAGRPLLLKPEQRQRTGSFKFRGAVNFVSRLQRGTPVVAASAGNHAQGVALAAAEEGSEATIYMPSDAALPKLAATRGYGAEVVLVDGTVDDCIVRAIEAAERAGATFVPPFDDPLVIAGQGTIGLEIADEAPQVETVVVPIGGGGLVSGIAAALAHTRPEVRVVGVEAAGAAKSAASLEAGYPVRLGRTDTFCDGIALKSLSDLTFAHIRRHVDEIVTVTDEDVGVATLALLERAKAVVEPAGAASVAAVLSGRISGEGPVLAVVSGGNVDPLLLGRILTHGMSAAGRFLEVEVVIADRPGALAALTSELAALRANILHVDHRREGTDIAVSDTAVGLHLETRDHAHGEAIVAALGEMGFRLSRVG